MYNNMYRLFRKLTKDFIVYIILLFIICGAHNLQSEQLPAQEQAIQSVVFLSVPSKNQNNQNKLNSGTGFLVNIDDKLFLVTATHVADKMSVGSSITIGVDNDAAKTLNISDIAKPRGKIKWVKHPRADVAVLPLDPSSRILDILKNRALKPPILGSILEAPPRNRPLTIIGFPLGLGVIHTGPGNRISPITKEVKAASGLITLVNIYNNKKIDYFILDNPSVGGFSGAPVFILPSTFSKGAGMVFSDEFLFVGLVQATISDNTGGKFATIVPSAFVTQTLTSAYKITY